MRRAATGRAARWPIVACLLTGGCSQGGLAPRADEASLILDIFWALLAASAAVSLLVLSLWAWGALRRHRDDTPDARTEDVPEARLTRRFVIGGGLVMPAVVLAVFFGVQIASTVAEPQGPGDFVLEVTGHQYWWEVDYRGLDGVAPFETANQVHVPTGTDISVELRSDDVIHSFWVPQLGGKVDLVPGRVSTMVLSADQPGTYAGYCAEYCGLQHAWMKFEVVAMAPDAFRDWAERQAAPAPAPADDRAARGRETFLGESCVGCHTIRGVAERGDVGPDLTHLASRSEVGAGVLPLDEENLRAWVANPQAVKPGAQMPPQELDPDELDALVAYLMSLE